MSYPNPSTKIATEISAQVRDIFAKVDTDSDGKITSQELQKALVNSDGSFFSDQICSHMIKLFDNSKKGSINELEFQQLYIYVNEWLNVFRMYDTNMSGYIEESEFTHMLEVMGYKFTSDFVKDLLKKCDLQNNRMSVDQFILTCTQIQRYTQAFKHRDLNLNGIITIGFEDFLDMALNTSS